MVPGVKRGRMMVSASGSLRGAFRRHFLWHMLAGGIAVAGMPSVAHGETLAEAIAIAYDTNPDILAQRELLRAIN